ncbi:MAG: hypothetical protein R2880_02805 [Deinococcales bacterium]
MKKALMSLAWLLLTVAFAQNATEVVSLEQRISNAVSPISNFHSRNYLFLCADSWCSNTFDRVVVDSGCGLFHLLPWFYQYSGL